MSVTRNKKVQWSEYLDEAVYGANDGIVTTFAIVSGAVGGDLAGEAIIVLGMANLIADGFSMGVSSFLAIRTKEDVERQHRWFRRGKNTYARSRSLVTFGAFVVAGSVPLVPFLIAGAAGNAIWVSTVGSAITFFVVGGLRTIVTKRGFFASGFEMLTIGGVAALLAYGVGYGVQAFII